MSTGEKQRKKSERKIIQMSSTGQKKVTEGKLIQPSLIMIELTEVVDCSQTSQHSNSGN